MFYSDSLYENELLHERATDALFILLPEYLNNFMFNSDSLYENELLHERATDALFILLPEYLNNFMFYSDSLYENELLHERATDALFILLPEYLNKSQHGTWSFESIVEHLEEVNKQLSPVGPDQRHNNRP